MGMEFAQRGVLCMANDPVVWMLEGFLASLRRFNRELPVAIIPFDDRIDDTRRIADN